MADEKPQPPGSNTTADESPPDVETGHQTGLNRTLGARHLTFLALGGCIGTGIFLSTGPALAQSGPVSLLLAFILLGCVAYSVMAALGEMVSLWPISGGFSVYPTRLVDPSLGFSAAWIYWWSWAITYALELTAAGLIIEFWTQSVNIGIWIAVFWVIFTAVNFLPVKWIGEFEMWFSSIKIVTIIGFFIFGICVNAGVGDQGYIGFRYWSEPGAFAPYLATGPSGRFAGFWSATITAAFSWLGVELVTIGAGETANPRETIPRAVRWTFIGTFVLVVGTVFFTVINLPYDNPNLLNTVTNASASPLVIIAQLAGVQVLPSLLNAVLLTAVLTAANSDVFSSSRILLGLADEGHAPAFFRATNRLGTPYWAVAFSASMGLFGFLNLSSGGQEAFKWLLNLNTTAGIISWALICLCHLRFRKALAIQGVALEELPYIAPLQPYLSWFGLVSNSLIVLTCGFAVFVNWSTSEFLTSYLSLIIFVVLYMGHKLIYRPKLVKISEIDLTIGRAGI